MRYNRSYFQSEDLPLQGKKCVDLYTVMACVDEVRTGHHQVKSRGTEMVHTPVASCAFMYLHIVVDSEESEEVPGKTE